MNLEEFNARLQRKDEDDPMYQALRQLRRVEDPQRVLMDEDGETMWGSWRA